MLQTLEIVMDSAIAAAWYVEPALVRQHGDGQGANASTNPKSSLQSDADRAFAMEQLQLGERSLLFHLSCKGSDRIDNIPDPVERLL